MARKMKTYTEMDTNGEAPERGSPQPQNEIYATESTQIGYTTESTQIGVDGGSVGDFLCLV